MQFVEALKLRSKLFFLFLLITLGLISVGITGSMHINSMKKNMDSLYFGSLVPVVELNEILHTYNNGLDDIVHKAHRLEVSPDETISKIEASLLSINKKWKNYESHYKNSDELEYVEYARLEIKATNRYFLKLHKLIKEGADLRLISMGTLEKKISTIHSVIQKLVNYEITVAQYERKKFLIIYEKALLQLVSFLVIIIILVLGISLYVFRSIQDDHSKLEIAGKKLKKLNKKLESASYTDSLTNLHNRRYFNLVYERELKRARRSKSYITFMMLDIDYFKQYNDTYGHLEGDKALRSVAKVLKESLHRPSDYVFRLGGEEFGILLSDTDESNSADMAGNITHAIKAQKIEHTGSLVGEYLSISIGIVSCIADETLDDSVLLSRADEMLYKAKDSGRDRYVITSNASSL